MHPALQAALADRGITEPTPIQAQAIPHLLRGADVIGQARTGSGKTIAFAGPMVQRCDPAVRGIQGLVLVPTRELAIQVGEVMAMLAKPLRVEVTLLYGGRALGPERNALHRAHIVVGTPGRTLDHLQQGTLSLKGVRTLVLDEADEMLDKGFGPSVQRIIAGCPTDRLTALFSATLPEWVRSAAERYLRNAVTVRVDATETQVVEIEHLVYDVPMAYRFDALKTLLSKQGDDPIIVFGRTKHGVRKLARQLEAVGFSVGALQGNMSQNARERVMTDFRAGAVRVLVATNVAARGLDIERVEQVINYELPESAELFTHRVGRTGRMGRSGEAITFLTEEDAPKWREFERNLKRSFPRQRWPRNGAKPTPPPVVADPREQQQRRSAQLESPRPPARQSQAPTRGYQSNHRSDQPQRPSAPSQPAAPTRSQQQPAGAPPPPPMERRQAPAPPPSQGQPQRAKRRPEQVPPSPFAEGRWRS